MKESSVNTCITIIAIVGVVDDGKSLDVSSTTSCGIKLDSIAFTPEILLKVMRNIKRNSSPGPDGYPPVLLKKSVSQSCTTSLNHFYLIYVIWSCSTSVETGDSYTSV